MSAPASAAALNLRATRAFTLRVPAAEVAAALRDPAILRRVLRPDLDLTPADGGWEGGPPGGERSWRIEVREEEDPAGLAWECWDEAEELSARGTVKIRPAPGDEGTEVIAAVEGRAAGGAAGAWVARHLPGTLPFRANEALRRFKALLEAGEIPTTEGQSTGAGKESP